MILIFSLNRRTAKLPLHTLVAPEYMVYLQLNRTCAIACMRGCLSPRKANLELVYSQFYTTNSSVYRPERSTKRQIKTKPFYRKINFATAGKNVCILFLIHRSNPMPSTLWCCNSHTRQITMQRQLPRDHRSSVNWASEEGLFVGLDCTASPRENWRRKRRGIILLFWLFCGCVFFKYERQDFETTLERYT